MYNSLNWTENVSNPIDIYDKATCNHDRLKVTCHHDLLEEKNFSVERKLISKMLYAVTKEFDLYINGTVENNSPDLPWWRGELPLRGFVSTALVRQFNTINIQEYPLDNRNLRPDLWVS